MLLLLPVSSGRAEPLNAGLTHVGGHLGCRERQGSLVHSNITNMRGMSLQRRSKRRASLLGVLVLLLLVVVLP